MGCPRRNHKKHNTQEGGITRIKAKDQTQYVAGEDVDYLLLKLNIRVT